jgi:arabinan endo-1,5-alpha-L-arabinosidase
MLRQHAGAHRGIPDGIGRLPGEHTFVKLAILIACALAISAAEAPSLLQVSGDTERVHDPSIARQGDTYYVFCTGRAPGGGVIPIRSSTDLHHWKLSGSVFAQLPEWALKEIPKARDAWAPDISYYNGSYHLYYAVSTFGSQESVIGLATNATLDPESPEYQWIDRGLVVHSYKDKQDWNAIDPNLFIQDARHVWLNWGSFWGGIKMRRVDPATGKLSATDGTLYSLASRPRKPPVDGSIEAPFLIRHGRYYYLFVSFDFCCRGVKSTYRVMVGRSRKVTGPYLDREQRPMTEGGATEVIAATTPDWRGPGHEAVLQDRGRDYLIFHAYQGTTGRPYLQISTIEWKDGWPTVANLP